ncbi:MAG: DNA polymerase III subunit delta' [Rhodospirillales bacterium]|jgi:DNA polymerase III subunit delta'|nr:DNA polymerase III subunit delta' [Rhodospirillales bacterium]MBT4039981.1 DNA polymerase III subunit delta' [Rhodospirillales bacterium]MBT4625806.1 DNA polymerase III subunit delta' [Rhodospirillales bacterium]MBT5351686.1 DNA polymerase III subunit delta' [Rhodospirillales bacterium]MBT5519192.1 DNA polymerase III subunit delta' [Rhodospirillales bacterium]
MSDLNEHLPPEARDNAFLCGHEAAEAELRTAFESGRLAHAWLITGPKGIGKANLAYRFARHVLKASKQSVEAPVISADAGLFGALPAEEVEFEEAGGLYVSPDDPVFKRVAAHGHSDLLGIERAWTDDKKKARKTAIAVDDVRQVNGFLRLTPGEGGWRVVIVDAADEMNANAANALLKVLEEPPSRALLLLVSHSPGRLLPTIRSRCRRLSLNPLSDGHVSTLLERYAPDLNPTDRDTLVQLSDGSIGRALELADEGGLEVHRELMDLLGDLPTLNMEKVHKLGDKLARKEAEAAFRTARDLLHWILSQVIRESATGGAAGAINGPENAMNARLASLAALDRWLEVWEKITRLMERADGANLDRKQVILNVFHILGQVGAR